MPRYTNSTYTDFCEQCVLCCAHTTHIQISIQSNVVYVGLYISISIYTYSNLSGTQTHPVLANSNCTVAALVLVVVVVVRHSKVIKRDEYIALLVSDVPWYFGCQRKMSFYIWPCNYIFIHSQKKLNALFIRLFKLAPFCTIPKNAQTSIQTEKKTEKKTCKLFDVVCD